jgi:hypothetical protein
VSSDFVALGDEIDELHVKVGKGVSEGADPSPCLISDPAGSNLDERVVVVSIDDLFDEAGNERLVVLGR